MDDDDDVILNVGEGSKMDDDDDDDDDDVVLNVGEVDVNLRMSGNRINKSGAQKTKKGRYHDSPNWSQVCSDLSRLLGLNQILNLSFSFGGFLLLLETGLALFLLVLYAVSLATMRVRWRHCAMCVGITVNSITLLIFFIATLFAVLDLGSKMVRVDVMKGLKLVVHSVILLLQVSTLIVEFTELCDSAEQDFTIFIIILECLVIIGNIFISKSEYAIASQQRLLASSGTRRKVKRRGERKRYYKRLQGVKTMIIQ